MILLNPLKASVSRIGVSDSHLPLYPFIENKQRGFRKIGQLSFTEKRGAARRLF